MVLAASFVALLNWNAKADCIVTPPWKMAPAEVNTPEAVIVAAVRVPVSVGEADRTMLPVPVTALDRATPP